MNFDVETGDRPSQKQAFVDEKFDSISNSLRSRGWHVRRDCQDDCSLIWTNLAKVNFNGILERQHDRPASCIVNHLRGAQHLSNKAFLAYHTLASGLHVSMPPQWSAAFEDVPTLLGLVHLNALYIFTKKLSTAASVAAAGCAPPTSTVLDSEHTNNKKGLELLDMVQRALLMDTDWASSDIATSARELLVLIHSYSDAIDTSTSNSTSTTATTTEWRETLASFERRHPWVRWSGINEIWIIKPVGSSCGNNIVCVEGLRGVLNAVRDMQYKCVVQKYIERPLLVRNNRKFDIRQWVLVTSVDPLIIYGFSECYLRLSSLSFSLDTKELANPRMHLCNHAVQKQQQQPQPQQKENEETVLTAAAIAASLTTTGKQESDSTSIPLVPPPGAEATRLTTAGVKIAPPTPPATAAVVSARSAPNNPAYSELARPINPIDDEEACSDNDNNDDTDHNNEEDDDGNDPVCDTMMTQHQFNAELLHRGLPDFTTAILPQIQSITMNAVSSVRDKLTRIGDGFEWLGLDLMVTEQDLTVLLIEVNVSPDISMSTPVTSRLVSAASEDVFRVLLDGDSHHAATTKVEVGAASEVAAVTKLTTSSREATTSAGEEAIVGAEGKCAPRGAVAADYHHHRNSGRSSTAPPPPSSSSQQCSIGLHMEGDARNCSHTTGSPNRQLQPPPLPQQQHQSPHWVLWHKGEVRGKGSDLLFARKKREVGALSTNDYAPRKAHVADRIYGILQETTNKNNNSNSSSSRHKKDSTAKIMTTTMAVQSITNRNGGAATTTTAATNNSSRASTYSATTAHVNTSSSATTSISLGEELTATGNTVLVGESSDEEEEEDEDEL